MPAFTKKELQNYEKGGLVVIGVGLLLVLCTMIPYDSRGFWIGYIEGFRGAGWMALLVGSIWTLLASASLRSSFFSMETRLSAEKLSAYFVGIVIAVVILLWLILPRLPATPPAKLPPDPKSKEQILMLERNFRYFVSSAIIMAGAAVALFPCLRFFKQGRIGRGG